MASGMAWRTGGGAPGARQRDAASSGAPAGSDAQQNAEAARVARLIARDYYQGRLDLSARGIEAGGDHWPGMPAARCVRELKARGASDRTVRRFLTFISAMNRARNADLLWRAGSALFKSHPRVFDPAIVAEMEFDELLQRLSRNGVSQRHGPDTNAWAAIARSLAGENDSPVRRVIERGSGDVRELLRDLKSRDRSGATRFPLLRGPKIGPMWIRILASPGGARITSMEAIPVAVDTHVRRVTENLGVADTRNLSEAQARSVIQAAWKAAATGIGGPEGIAGTAAALDPALWFYGKNGCSHCEALGQQAPIGEACGGCRLGEPTS